jgi:hypothetical protein
MRSVRASQAIERPAPEVLQLPASLEALFGPVEHLGVAVGAPEQQGQLLSLRHLLSGDLRVLQHPPLEHLERGVVAHQLLDGRARQRGVGPEPLELVGVAEQRPPSVAGDVHRGLVARVQQEHAGPDQLVLGEALALLEDLGQPRDQVLARMAPALPRELTEVRRELLAGRDRGPGVLVRRVELVHPADLRGPRPAGAKRNLAARLASYNSLLFIDSDCLATSDLLTGHVAALATAGADVAGVAGRTVMYGAKTALWQALDYSRLYNTCFDFAETYEQVGWGVTCNLSVRRDVFTRLGGFDESAFTLIGGEDVDLGARACDLGYRWVTSVEATAMHRRDSLMRYRQVVAKLFTYGRADVFLTSRHPRRRTWQANPFALGALAGLATLPLVALAPLLLLVVPAAAAVPPVAAVVADLLRRGRPRATVYGPAVAPFPPRSDGRLRHVWRHLTGAVVDQAFNAGIVWEALRRWRPALAMCAFVYSSEPEFRFRPEELEPSILSVVPAGSEDARCATGQQGEAY